MKDIACKKCSWKDKCDGNKQQCRVDVFIDDFCKKCDFWNTESLICMFGELDCDDPDRRKCREFLGLKIVRKNKMKILEGILNLLKKILGIKSPSKGEIK